MRLLASLEAFALVHLVFLSGVSNVVRYVSQNRAGDSVRQWMFVAPALGAVLVYFGLPFVLSRRPAWAFDVERVVRLATPLLVLWMLPALLTHGVFPEHETFLMLATSALVIGTEAALRHGGQDVVAALAALTRRLRPWLADALAGLLIAALFAFACFGSIRVHHKFLTSSYDFGLFENLFFTTLHGEHGIAFELPYFAEHAEFLLYVLLPVYRLVPRSETLLVLQAFFIVGAAVPLNLLARRWLGSSWQALAITAVYLVFPSVHGSVFYDFHFLPLSAFFVLWAAYFYARRAWLGFWSSVVLAMTCREDVALGIGAVGLGLALIGRSRKLGTALAVLGTLWFGLVKLVWMERFGSQVFSDYYAELIPAGSAGFESVIRTLVGNPLYAFSRTLTDNKLLLALHLLTPLAFLPVRQVRTWPLFLPGLLVIGLSTSKSAISQVQFHYSMHFVPYLFVAAVIALAMRRKSVRGPAIVAMLLGAAVSAAQFSAFFGKSFRTSFHEVSFDWTSADAERRSNFERLAARIPDNASVSAGEYEGPHLSRRRAIINVKEGLGDKDYVMFSARSLRWGGKAELRDALRTGTYGALEVRGDLALLQRGAPTALNAKALRLVGGS